MRGHAAFLAQRGRAGGVGGGGHELDQILAAAAGAFELDLVPTEEKKVENMVAFLTPKLMDGHHLPPHGPFNA